MKLNLFLQILLVVIVLSSCRSQRDIVYLEDMSPVTEYAIRYKQQAKIYADDRLLITVSSKNPELAMPFNIEGGNIQLSERGDIIPDNRAGASPNKGYRVNLNGKIDFPLLGELHVEGLTLNELSEMIKDKIIQGNFIKDPIVRAEFGNFKIFMLGEVASVGEYIVEGDRISLLEAIAKAGDLTERARLDRVAVIREKGTTAQMIMHDLRSKDIFSSPSFYLQQNDIVYVAPRYVKADREDNLIRYGTLAFSTITSVLTLILLFTRNINN
ncbi:MAG: polysaccharide biosynthesis/export family protein [Bacteroidia bacterium]|nr:polysaccharide biosynthesis/export family protein [Bacteroidia bacterium]